MRRTVASLTMKNKKYQTHPTSQGFDLIGKVTLQGTNNH